MGCPDWHTAMHSLRLRRLLWIYCPGHAGVSGNERADRLASTADITPGLQLGRAEVFRGLRNFLNRDRPEHHSTDRLKERGVEKGSGRHSTLHGRERSVFNLANVGTVSRATLGKLLRDGTERVWAFPSDTMPSCAETDLLAGQKLTAEWHGQQKVPDYVLFRCPVDVFRSIHSQRNKRSWLSITNICHGISLWGEGEVNYLSVWLFGQSVALNVRPLASRWSGSDLLMVRNGA